MVERCGKWLMFTCLFFQTLMDGKGNKATADGNELLRKEMEKLREELKGSEEGEEDTHTILL